MKWRVDEMTLQQKIVQVEFLGRVNNFFSMKIMELGIASKQSI